MYSFLCVLSFLLSIYFIFINYNNVQAYVFNKYAFSNVSSMLRFVRNCSHKSHIWIDSFFHELMIHDVSSNLCAQRNFSHKFHIWMIYYSHELMSNQLIVFWESLQSNCFSPWTLFVWTVNFQFLGKLLLNSLQEKTMVLLSCFRL